MSLNQVQEIYSNIVICPDEWLEFIVNVGKYFFMHGAYRYIYIYSNLILVRGATRNPLEATRNPLDNRSHPAPSYKGLIAGLIKGLPMVNKP